MQLYTWNLLEQEAMNARMGRKAVHSANLTIARLELLQYATVPEHSHINEQVTMVERGALKFFIGGKEQIVRAGDLLVIAPHEPHAVEALEDTIALDVFAPPREDWQRGDDAYLRK